MLHLLQQGGPLMNNQSGVPGEDWRSTIEGFARRSLNKIYMAYGYNPWFWGVAWPAVLGAAAADFWPRVSTSLERRAAAHAATRNHLEVLYADIATDGTDPLALFPAPVVAAAEDVRRKLRPEPSVGQGAASDPSGLPTSSTTYGG